MKKAIAARKVTAIRGSEKLFESRVINPEDLKKLHGVLQQRDLKLVDWWIRGQPRPDIFFGAVDAKVSQLPELVRDLTSLGDLRLNLDIFPYGIPKPDLFRVQFKV